MIFLKLFFTFMKIGMFTFGGGYAIVAVIQDEMVRLGHMTSEEILNFIAISEATPGTFAVNVSTFAGFKAAGYLGAIVSVLGLITPSIIIICIIAKIYDKFKSSTIVKNVLKGIRPAVVGVVFGVGIKLLINTFFPNGFAQIDLNYNFQDL